MPKRQWKRHAREEGEWCYQQRCGGDLCGDRKEDESGHKTWQAEHTDHRQGDDGDDGDSKSVEASDASLADPAIEPVGYGAAEACKEQEKAESTTAIA